MVRVKQVLKFLDKHLEEYLIAILLIALTLIMLLQIVMRYVFNNSLSWPEELSRYCFVYITFLTLGYCVRNDSMLRLDILKELLPSKIWTVLQAIVRIVNIMWYSPHWTVLFQIPVWQSGFSDITVWRFCRIPDQVPHHTFSLYSCFPG